MYRIKSNQGSYFSREKHWRKVIKEADLGAETGNVSIFNGSKVRYERIDGVWYRLERMEVK